MRYMLFIINSKTRKKDLYTDSTGKDVFSHEEAENYENILERAGVKHELWQVKRIVKP
ncbi:hypothetical protein KJ684_01500 [Patescibacteria group bacterium]|nr:hypothetical protein [Patescibacteria group bacterium]